MNVIVRALVGMVIILSGVSVGLPGDSAQGAESLDRSAQVDAIFAQWDRPDSPGCAMAVLKDGHILYERGYGIADLSHDVPITPQTPFHVASVSKQFTAAAILLLAGQGKLSLDDDIHRFLPELPDFDARVTIRHLLHHTSGLRDQWNLLELAGYRYSLDLITDEDVMSLVRRQKALNFSPGSEHVYSNTGWTLLGQIVQRVSGQSLRQFTTRNIFAPLGMTSTHFRDDHAEITLGEAFGYVRSKDGSFRLSVTNFDTVGATSLYTTVEDLAKWDANFYAQKVGGPNFTQQMTHTDPLTTGQAAFYAMGLRMLQYRGLPVVDHTGADAGYRADLLRFPAQHFSVITLCNTPPLMSVASLNHEVADLYLADAFPMPKPASYSDDRPLALKERAGKDGFYRSTSTGEIVRLAVEEGVLKKVEGHEKTALRTDGRSKFLFPDSIDPGHFEPARGAAQRMLVRGEGKPAEVWERLPAYALAPGAQEDFVGRYYSEELDTTYTIEDRADKLVLIRKRHTSEELVPVAQDLFAFSFAALAFARDEKGRVTDMRLTTGRVRNLKFVRLGPQCP